MRRFRDSSVHSPAVEGSPGRRPKTFAAVVAELTVVSYFATLVDPTLLQYCTVSQCHYSPKVRRLGKGLYCAHAGRGAGLCTPSTSLASTLSEQSGVFTDKGGRHINNWKEFRNWMSKRAKGRLGDGLPCLPRYSSRLQLSHLFNCSHTYIKVFDFLT